MNWRAIRAVIRKDLKVALQSKGVVIPLILVPVIMLVVLPGLGGLVAAHTDLSSPDAADFADLLDKLPDRLLSEFSDVTDDNHRLVLYLMLYMFAPFFLIVPLMVASVIAADSFAGEKERKTLEALIYTPTSDRELYIAKVLSPWIAAVAVTLLSLVVYAVVANAVAWPFMERVFFPTASWIVLTLWVAPAAAGLGLSAMVLVSSRVSTFQEAYQLGGMVVLPVILLAFGQIAGVIYFDIGSVMLVGLVLWAVVLGLLWYGARTFKRGELLMKL